VFTGAINVGSVYRSGLKTVDCLIHTGGPAAAKRLSLECTRDDTCHVR